jgi:hypothetical protein
MTISCSSVSAFLPVNLSMVRQERPAWERKMRQLVLVASTSTLSVEVEQVGQPFRHQRHCLVIRAIHHFPYDPELFQGWKQAWSTMWGESLGS